MAPGIENIEYGVKTATLDVGQETVPGISLTEKALLSALVETAPSAANTVVNLFSLSGTTTLITGAARGLGITLAGAVIEAGGDVECVDILDSPSTMEWEKVRKQAKSRGLHVAYHRCDITNEAAVQNLFRAVAQAAEQRSRPLAGTVCCAGIQQKVPALEYSGTDFDRILRVNVTGTFLTAKYAAQEMVTSGTPGSIVLVASMSGQIANRGLTCSAYNSSKAAVQQLCRSLAQELGQHGIRVNTLSPGYIRTAMTDALLEAEPAVEEKWMAGALLGRLGVPEDFTAPTVFLLSSGSRFMTGADLRVDGGHCASA